MKWLKWFFLGEGFLFLVLFGVELFEVRTDSTYAILCVGFALCMAGVFLLFSFLEKMEREFVTLRQNLADTFRQLAKMDRDRDKTSYPVAPPSITYFNPSPSYADITKKFGDDVQLDMMTLAQLKEELIKAEKAEDYEKAARIKARLDQRK